MVQRYLAYLISGEDYFDNGEADFDDYADAGDDD